MVGKRKMLVVLSLELLLYIAAYLIALFTAFMSRNAANEPGWFIFAAMLILGPPAFVAIRNIARVMNIRAAAREEPGLREEASFTTKLIVAQSIAVLLTPIMGIFALTLCLGMALAGLVASRGVSDAPPPPKDDEQPPTT